MAHQSRTSADSLNEILQTIQKQPYRYSLFAAIRLIDCLFAEQPRTGTSDRPGFEKLRIGQSPSLKFAASSIVSFSQRSSDQTWHLLTFYFGMFGPNGPLPLHLTDYVQQRLQHNRDETLARFSDIFHHRMAGFFYRAWAEAQPTVHMDRRESDRFDDYVASLCGMGTPSLHDRDAMPDAAKLYFGSLLANHSKNGSGLTAILSQFFGESTEVIPFISHWVTLPKDCLWTLGRNPEASQLGVNTTIGSRVHDSQQKFRIVLGPMNYSSFFALLPHGTSMTRLRSIVDQYVGLEFSWDAKLILKKSEVRPMKLELKGILVGQPGSQASLFKGR